jgi:hypothetical protein
VTAAAVALKLALEDPAAIAREAGTVRLALFDNKPALVADAGAAERVTVHRVVPAPVRLLGVQLTALIVVGAVTSTRAVVLLAPSAAVSVAETAAVTDPAAAVNCAVFNP